MYINRSQRPLSHTQQFFMSFMLWDFSNTHFCRCCERIFNAIKFLVQHIATTCSQRFLLIKVGDETRKTISGFFNYTHETSDWLNNNIPVCASAKSLNKTSVNLIKIFNLFAPSQEAKTRFRGVSFENLRLRTMLSILISAVLSPGRFWC